MFNKILRSLVLLFTLSFGAGAGAVTVTLQDGLAGYTGTADNWIVANSGANINRGADVNVAIRAVSDYGIYRFPIFAAEGGPVPNNATIQSATLSLYKAYGPDAVMRAQRLTRAWTEMGSTWNSTGTVNWTTPGGDVISTPDGTGSVPDSAVNNCADGIGHEICWLNINVTTGVQAFAQAVASGGASTNFGWRVSAVSSSEEFTPKNFNSRNVTNFPQYRPKLTITYTTGPVGCNTGTSRPYDGAPVNGNPIAIAASGATTFEAEHFNCGGQDVAYHDNVAGNAGNGSFRTTEDVDIYTSNDPNGGGFVIQNFYTGEWMTYTVNVAQAGTYDFAMRASADNPGSFHLEVDGTDVTGNVPVPNTGNLANYVWVTKAGVNLPAGQHVLKLVSDQQFFWVNQLRFTPATTQGPTANFTWSQVSGTLSATFNASSSSAPAGASITSLTLRYGHGTPEAQDTWTNKDLVQTHPFPQAGTYTVKLTVTDSNGATSPEFSQSVQINDPNQTTFPSSLTQAQGETRPTFHSMSLYWADAPTPASDQQIFVRYHKLTEDPNVVGWKQALPLWYDTRNANFDGIDALPYAVRARGSVVYLTPDTDYVFELGVGTTYASTNFTRQLTGRTWKETFTQVGATNVIPAGNTSFPISSGGSSTTGYAVYDGQGNARALPGTSAQQSCVRITASYVIVRNLVCTGSYRMGITIAPGVTNVVIEDNDISDWDWQVQGNLANWGNYGAEEIGGVHLEGNNSGIVIQRNKIHDPKWGAFPWDFGHPKGPTGIMTVNPGQQNVIRYNELYASGPNLVAADKKHWLYDGMMGNNNFSTQGFPGSDSDIYHNYVRNSMDDGIEVEGGGLNVRVWGNYIDYASLSSIATTTVHYGPTYVFRNVTNRVRGHHLPTMPEDDAWERGVGFKSYGKGHDSSSGFTSGGGRTYLFNNTFLQQPGNTYSPAQASDLGIASGLNGGSQLGDDGLREVWSRNNIYDHFRNNGSSIVVHPGAYGDKFHDLRRRGIEDAPAGCCEVTGPAEGRPVYKAQNGWEFFPRLSDPNAPPTTNDRAGLGVGVGSFQQDPSSLGYNAGLPLPNFTFDIDNLPFARKSGVEVGASVGAPDMGAHENGSTQSMKFGIPASQ